jgi:hypothetical protein
VQIIKELLVRIPLGRKIITADSKALTAESIAKTRDPLHVIRERVPLNRPELPRGFEVIDQEGRSTDRRL